VAVCAGVLVLGTGVAGAGRAGGWPGDPDGTWGACGQASFTVVDGEAGEARSVVRAGDGYVAGGSTGTRALVARFTSTGALDRGFGSRGKRAFGSGDDAEVRAVARQGDGKIVAVGARSAGGAVDSLVARVTAGGDLDDDFNGTGRVVLDLGDDDRADAVAVRSNGAVVVGATAGSAGAVARLTPGGSPDQTFSGDGRRTGLPLTVQALVLQPDGKVVVGGRTGDDFALMRLDPDGSTDPSFGGADGVVADAGGFDSVTALALDADGKVVVAGYGNGPAGAGHTVVRRYHADGTRDTGFQSTDRAYGLGDEPVGVVVQPDGKIVVAGNSRVGPDNDVLVLRLNSDGSRDQSFGIGGVSLADAGARPIARDLVARSDGRVLVAGSLHAGGLRRLALLRYQGDTATAPRPAQGYVIDGSGTPHGFTAGCATKPPPPVGFARWPGADRARGIAVLPGGRGLEVDATGRLHGFRIGDGPATGWEATGGPTWPGRDLARGVAVVPEGTGGYVLRRDGRLYPFRLRGGTKPAVPSDGPSWPGRDFARGVALLPNGAGGYVLDASGGLHPFGGAPGARRGAPSWPGQDLARGVTIAPDGSGGWVVDAHGGLHPFGIGSNAKPPAATGGPMWAARTARGVATLP
jgi:uncharacterized delta-60 repeat protein